MATKAKAPPNPTRLKLARPLYGPSHPKGPSVGPDVVSVKRATARGWPDIFPWADFDQIYNGRLEKAWRVIQAKNGIAPTSGQYGTLSHDLLRHKRRQGYPLEWAFDAIAINLMQAKWEAIHNPPPSPEEFIKATLVDYMRRALAAAALWHYEQWRPMQNLGVNPDKRETSDCSGGVTGAFYWARMVTGLLVPDPNGRTFDGYGNTDSLWAANSGRRVTSGMYEVGDLALYWAHNGHVSMCMEPGDSGSSNWWSNGREAAPNTMSLYSRSDLRGVLRPKLLT